MTPKLPSYVMVIFYLVSGTGVTINAVHPGVVRTDIHRYMAFKSNQVRTKLTVMRMIKLLPICMNLFGFPHFTAFDRCSTIYEIITPCYSSCITHCTSFNGI